MLRICFVLLTILCIANSVYATNNQIQPILRIETGRHTARITSLDVDAKGQYFVTSSVDKTLRVWDADSGKVIKILRPYIGKEADEGIIYSASISQDGKYIACTYETSPITIPGNNNEDGTPTKFRSLSLTIFENGSWKKLASVGSFEPSRLMFSPDGKFLVAYGPSQISIYNTKTWRLHASLLNIARYDDAAINNDTLVLLSSNELIFYKIDNKYAPKSKDENGYSEIIEASLRIKLTGKQKLPSTTLIPFSLKLSPDGRSFAIGYAKGLRVITGNLGREKSVRELDTSGANDFNFVSKASFSSVTWSSNGRYLYAGGLASELHGFKTVIRRWDLSPKKTTYTDTPSTIEQPIRSITSTATGNVIFTTDLSVGIISGGEVRLLSPFLAHEEQSSVSLSEDGLTAAFYYQTSGSTFLGDRYAFAIKERILAEASSGSDKLKSNPVNLPGLTLIRPYTGDAPTLNGIKLDLAGMSIKVSTISSAGDSCVVGTDRWKLIRYDASANVVWSILLAEVATGITISDDNRFVVVSLADGTIRWFNHQNGEELFALFLAKDRKKWVIWTPSGYYDASPKGDELIGWYFRESKEKPSEFYPASRFKSMYYRPDIINKVLETLSESKAIVAANEESGRKPGSAPAVATIVPPTVTILSPVNGNSFSEKTLTVRYRVMSASDEPVTNVKILVDGRPAATGRGLKAVEKAGIEQTITITVPGKDCEIGVIAENRYSSSEPATVRLKWIGKKVEEFVIKPKMYLLSIGVSEYKQGDLKLKYAAKDAQDFVKAMEMQKGGLYRDVVSRVLVDSSATKDSILDSLEWIQKEATNNDVAVIFIAGHGVNDSNGTYYFLPENVEVDKLKRTGVSIADIKQTVSTLAGKVLLFVDTCHSGNIFGGRRALADINAIVNDLSSAENGAVVFASSTGRQYSLEKDEWKNGAFTKALVEGISGKADYTKKGSITVNMLDLYLSERVKELTEGKQTPATAKPTSVPDFPLAVRQ